MIISKFTHQHLQSEQEECNNYQKRSKYLPILCSSSSTKQAVIKLSEGRHNRSASASSTVSDEPLSPRVGCMGQVKRNNKVNGFPSKTLITYNNTIPNTNPIINDQIISSNSIVKYHKLKKFFSSKTLIGSPTIVTAKMRTGSGTHKGKSILCTNQNQYSINQGIRNGFRKINDDNNSMKVSRCKNKIDENLLGSNGNGNGNEKGCLVNLVELDPPLPVMKQIQGINNSINNGAESMSLWKRRSGGTPLKSLQVQVTPQSCTPNFLLEASTV
ncbi:uncharacterized protein LOC130810383 [Amaranthus tricolor]|uniref:uncharacterized protein LOC130810383 n=1 Tax=Amaranthus tricolor TaxID=29722 RepID=UPI002590D6C6|nr:uncharacterized protein LOC130810383 [Amaranthus tricolor]